MNRRLLVLAVLFPFLCLEHPSGVRAQAATTPLATVRVTHAVLADGKPLAAGTYQVRLTSDEPPTVVGEAAHSEQWVEFVKGGTVAGREVATVISNANIHSVAKGPVPAPGTSRVEPLVGGEYLRVWIAKKGEHYLINLAMAR